ncbi:MAG: hypothetical protein M0R39_07535 [Prolixibacteraceae bacterium]|nr:hypothetical protein [Prolixibacteraceae bacterium]
MKDDFSTGQSVYSKDVTLASVFPLIGSKKPWELVMSFMLVDGSLSISVTHQSQKYSSGLSSIFFRFKDGTVLKKETPSTTGDYNNGLGYKYKFTGFFLTKEELELFASKDLLKFQANFSYFPDYPIVEEDLKNKSIDRIRIDASCILTEFNSASTSKSEVKADLAYECKYNNDQTDAFTKKRIVYTTDVFLYDKTESRKRVYLAVGGNNTNGVNGIQLQFGLMIPDKVDATEMQAITKFDQVYLLLENDKIINLTDKEVSKFTNPGNFYVNYKLYAINDSIWKELKSTPLNKLRILLNNEEVATQDIDKKNSKAIMNVINCIDALGIPKSK